MAVVAGQGPESVQITVRNTFLNVVEEDEDPLFRTSSDPLGGQCQIEARHIAKAKQLASSSRSLYSHDEATETEDVMYRSNTYDPWESSLSLLPNDDVPSPVARDTGGAVMSTSPSSMARFSCGLSHLGEVRMTATAAPFVPAAASPATCSTNSCGSNGPWPQRPVPQEMRSRKGYGKGKGKDIHSIQEHRWATRKTEVDLGQQILLDLRPRVIVSQGPHFAARHRFHAETAKMGLMAPDLRTFTKEQFHGRLSVITEDRVKVEGLHRYSVQFCSGELSSADGVGFIFSEKLPCPKNIQKIVSIFVNKTGRIFMRAHAEVLRSDQMMLKPLELGDWIELEMNLEERCATFTVWPVDRALHASCVTLNFGRALQDLRTFAPHIPDSVAGFMAVVVKNSGVTVALAS